MKTAKLITTLGLTSILLISSASSAQAFNLTDPLHRVSDRVTTTVENVTQNVLKRKENREERREEIKNTVKENIEERQENRKENREERRDNIAELHANRLSTRFTFYGKRLQTIIDKLTTRLTTMSTNGNDVVAAQAKLAEAQAALTKANSLASQAVAAFQAITPAEFATQKEQASAARDLANQAREQFLQVLSLLKETVKLAKAAQ